jgi:phage terminase large subunit-like protein
MTGWERYCQGVTDGNIVVCDLVRRAVLRFLDMLEDERLEFKTQKVERVIAFFSILRHFKGKHSGKPFLLEDWQMFIIAAIYGFYYTGTNERVVTSVYIEMARKQGKTAFAAGLCLYHEIADGEAGAEVYLAANSREQAKIAFKFCSQFAKKMDPKGQILQIYRDYIDLNANVSTLKVLAADSSKLDGPDPSMYLLDEYHAAKDSSLKDVLQSGQGTRESPMSMIITTAGFDKLGPCFQYREMCVDVLNGIKDDERLFTIIYSLDEKDDWKDERVWIKSNPNLEVTVKMAYIRSQVKKAVNSPIDEVGVRTKTINQWCDSMEVWIPDHHIIKCTGDVDINIFGKETECYVGIDLSSTSDLTALSLMFPYNGKFYFKTFYYLPEEALSTKKYKEMYGDWARNKYLIITPGNVVDYDYILNDLVDLDSKLYILKIGYDAWNSTQFVINATNRGLPMEPISQSIGNFNRPTKELERVIMSGNAVIDNNPINRFCFKNVTMKFDSSGNAKPNKENNDKKIDGVIADIEALGVYLLTPQYSNSL